MTRKAGILVRVGSLNPVKVRAVEEVFGAVLSDGTRLSVEGVEVDSGVPEQPREADVFKGAENRARGAIGDADLGVGIEAGLFGMRGTTVDIQVCVIVDRDGGLTWGQGPAFRYPPRVYSEVARGRAVGEVMGELTGIEDIGRKEGSISYLTKGLLDRTGLTRQAVLMAMVPRIREELY